MSFVLQVITCSGSVTLPDSQGTTGPDGDSWFKVMSPDTQGGANEKTDLRLDCGPLVTYHLKFKSWYFQLKTECQCVWKNLNKQTNKQNAPKRLTLTWAKIY